MLIQHSAISLIGTLVSLGLRGLVGRELYLYVPTIRYVDELDRAEHRWAGREGGSVAGGPGWPVPTHQLRSSHGGCGRTGGMVATSGGSTTVGVR